MYTLNQIDAVVTDIATVSGVAKNKLIVTGSAAAVAIGYITDAAGISLDADTETFTKLINVLVGGGTWRLSKVAPYADKSVRVWQLAHKDPGIKINIFNVNHADTETFNPTTVTILTKEALIEQCIRIGSANTDALLSLLRGRVRGKDALLKEIESALLEEFPGYSTEVLTSMAKLATKIAGKYIG